MEAGERISLQQFPWKVEKPGVPRVPLFGTRVLGLNFLFLLGAASFGLWFFKGCGF